MSWSNGTACHAILKDVKVGNSAVLCICEIHDKNLIWMGCENGQLMIFDITTKRLLLQVCGL